MFIILFRNRNHIHQKDIIEETEKWIKDSLNVTLKIKFHPFIK